MKCGYFCIGLIYFMLAGKSLIVLITSLFSPYDFEKNDDIILSFFKMKSVNELITQRRKFFLKK